MTEPAAVVAQVLSNLGNDRRRATNAYLNITARAGATVPGRRVMSDVGFFESVQVTYINPARAHVSYGDQDVRRDPTQIVLIGYGLLDDSRRLRSSNPQDRLVRHNASVLRSGVELHPDVPTLVMSGDLRPDTSSTAKTQNVVRAMTSNQGPAPHFIVTRRGDLIIGPSIDGVTTVVPALKDAAIFIAVESMLVMSLEDHAARRFDRLIEAPLTPTQASTLLTLINKLLVAIGSTVPSTFHDAIEAGRAGFGYLRANALDDVPLRLFQQNPPALPLEGLTLNYDASTPATLFGLAASQGTYDLATQVWRPPGTPPTRAGRQEARTAIGEVDTAGAESAYLGAYATIAAEERSDAMQAQLRSQIFVQRHRVAHNDASTAGAEAARVAEVGAGSLLPTEVPANAGLHAYDFTTGLWGDNKAV